MKATRALSPDGNEGGETASGSPASSPDSALTDVNLPLERVGAGKVREMFELDSERLLMVATDRISAYDVVMAQGIRDKGKVLTQLSGFWFELLSDVCPHHLISAEFSDLPAQVQQADDRLRGRSMIVQKLQMLQLEFVVRGYLAGSGWKEYRESGQVCGVRLPEGLREADELPEPIFTPATKAQTGHDENISSEVAAGIIGAERLEEAAAYSVELYKRAAKHARERGIILADTKFEFGMRGEEIVLADEVLTPDSSRFWPADEWVPGKNPPSFDKQYLRDWLDQSGWDRKPPPPELPQSVIEGTRQRYLEALNKLTEQAV